MDKPFDIVTCNHRVNQNLSLKQLLQSTRRLPAPERVYRSSAVALNPLSSIGCVSALARLDPFIQDRVFHRFPFPMIKHGKFDLDYLTVNFLILNETREYR